MILDTRRLFLRLLPAFEIATVCDVGSMDGADALRFRRALPGAAILALEPNPHNLASMERDPRLRGESIRVLPLAASDRDAELPFFVAKADYGTRGDPYRKGLGSLHRRADGVQLADVVPVRATRLDRLLIGQHLSDGPIALWVDTEGMAFEAISGAGGVLDSTRMIHAEVETAPYIGAGQRLLADVEDLLTSSGFVLLATDQSRDALQLNALFVRSSLLAGKASEIARHARAARLRRRVKHAIHRVLPRRFRHVLVRGLIETRLR